MEKAIFLIGMITLLFVISCAPQEITKESNGKLIKGQQHDQEQQQQQKIMIRISNEGLSSEAASFVEKSKDVDNYYYLYQSKTRNAAGNLIEGDSYRVHVRGNQVLKEYLSPVKLKNDIFYNKVYLNLEAKTAVVTCDQGGVLCESSWKKAYIIDYGLEKLDLMPKEIIQNINPAAKMVGKEVIDDRKTTILEYQENGKTVHLFVDEYSGLPMKKTTYSLTGGEKVVEKMITFINLALRGVSAADVAVSSDFKLVE